MVATAVLTRQGQAVKPTLIAHTDQQAIADLVDRAIRCHCPIAFDIETTGFNPRSDLLVLVTIKPEGKQPVIIDARHMDRAFLSGVLTPLLSNPQVLLRGHNLLFDLLWMRVYLGVETKAKTYDTMLNELLILGVGFTEAREQKKFVDLKSTAARYGIPVSKEEREWFVGLDKRLEGATWEIVGSHPVERPAWFVGDKEIEDVLSWDGVGVPELRLVVEEENDYDWVGGRRPWTEPFPYEQLEYAVQDVAVVNLVASRQAAKIKEQGLEEVSELEGRVLPAIVGKSYYGVGVDREQFNRVLLSVQEEVERLGARLHEMLDVYVLEEREQEWRKRYDAFQAWWLGREQAVEQANAEWERAALEEYTNKKGVVKTRIRKDYDGPGWGEVKKAVTEAYYEAHGKLASVPALKYGVNLDSPAQVKTGINGWMKAHGYKQADGKYIALSSVDQNALAAYGSYEVVKVYLDYSDNATIIKRYGGDWFDQHAVMVCEQDGQPVECHERVYPGWNQLGAGTGRESSYGPNFQQNPTNGPGAGLRKGYVPAPGYKFVVADFSNIELRIAAELSNDQFLLGAFASGVDLHAATAELMFDLGSNPDFVAAKARGLAEMKKWTEEHDAVMGGRTLLNTPYRKPAKTCNFLVLYGGGARLLALRLMVQEAVAKQLMQKHRAVFAGVLEWMRKQGMRASTPQAEQSGRCFAVTRSGRRRWFDLPKLDIAVDTPPEEARQKREAWTGAQAMIRRQLANHPIQGLSADITKLAVALWHERYEGFNRRLVAVVHDELLIECAEAECELARVGLAECMYDAMKHFLHVVDLGKVEPKVSDWWTH